MMSNKLDLPFPVGTKAYIYVNQATFVDGLIQIAGEERQQAWDKGRFAAGVATRVGLFLRGDHLARMHLLARTGSSPTSWRTSASTSWQKAGEAVLPCGSSRA